MCRTGMHGRGKTHAALASNVAWHDDTWGTPLLVSRCRIQFFFFFFHDSSRHSSDFGWIALNWVDSRQLGPYRAKRQIQVEIKKKKKCKTHHLNLITNSKGPKLSHASSLHSNFSSLQLSLICLSVVSSALFSSLSFASLLCVEFSASLCCVL